ncbi:MAG: hypothetical protein AAGA93_19560 [Actinomycetota bacterium]
MTDFEPEEDLPPVAHVVLVYNGPVAPHWEMHRRYGDQKMLDDFWNRVHARLLLLPKHDPQFRRNRERVNRDAERERIICDWDLGDGDAESTITAVAPPPGAETAEGVEAPPVEEAAVEAVDAVEEAPAQVEDAEAAPVADADAAPVEDAGDAPVDETVPAEA